MRRSSIPRPASHPGVIIWPDAFGLRPAMREMARRSRRTATPCSCPIRSIAWRRRRVRHAHLRLPAPDAREAGAADGIDQRRRRRREGRARVRRVARPAEGSEQGEEDRHAGLLHGRRRSSCARRPRPDRIGAGGSFHGGGLVTDQPNSPHLLAPKIKARMYFGVAANDDKQQPDAKDKLKAAFEAAKVPAEVEVYSLAARLVHAGHAARRRRRSTTSPTPSARGANCWRYTRRAGLRQSQRT